MDSPPNASGVASTIFFLIYICIYISPGAKAELSRIVLDQRIAHRTTWDVESFFVAEEQALHKTRR